MNNPIDAQPINKKVSLFELERQRSKFDNYDECGKKIIFGIEKYQYIRYL